MAYYLSKRARIIYETFQKEISQIDFSKKGEDRVKEFLKAIDFENASKEMISSLLAIDNKKFENLTTNGVFHGLDTEFTTNGFLYYLDRTQDNFRHWCHCDEVRQVAGKATGASDIFRLYYHYIVCHKK